MKFKINRETLLKPLQQVASVASGRPALPILGNLLFDASGDGLKITGTDLELELIATITELEVTETGSITLPCRKLTDIIKSLPANVDITFTLKDHNVMVTSGRSRFKMSTLPAQDFPNTQPDETQHTIRLKMNDFKSSLQKAATSMANQDVRYYLNGVYLLASENNATFVGTDGHRMAVATTDASSTAEEPTSVIIPRKSVTEIIKLIGTGEDEIELMISNNTFKLCLANLQISSKLVDGKFPDYRRVIPQQANNILLVNRKQLIDHIKLAMILSNEKFRKVAFTYSSQGLTIESSNPEQEEATEVMSIESYEGQESLVVGYNGNYMIDALNSLSSENVRIRQGEATSSCQVEDEDNSDVIFIVMPIRI